MQKNLYQQIILDHNKNPKNFGELKFYTHHAEGYNPLCGDHIWLYLKIDKLNGKNIILEVAFKGQSCAICKASASLMTEAIKGNDFDFDRRLLVQFENLIKGKLDPDKDKHHLKKLAVFSGIWQYPARVKCALLPWRTLQSALEKTLSSDIVNTEKNED